MIREGKALVMLNAPTCLPDRFKVKDQPTTTQTPRKYFSRKPSRQGVTRDDLGAVVMASRTFGCLLPYNRFQARGKCLRSGRDLPPICMTSRLFQLSHGSPRVIDAREWKIWVMRLSETTIYGHRGGQSILIFMSNRSDRRHRNR